MRQRFVGADLTGRTGRQNISGSDVSDVSEVRHARGRLRSRLFTLGVATALATTGVTAMGAAVTPASATITDTVLYVGDIDGGLSTINVTTGSHTYNDNYSGIPVQLIANPAGTTLYDVDVMDDYAETYDTRTATPLGGIGTCNRPEAESLNSASNVLYVSCNDSQGGVDSEVEAINVANPSAPALAATIPIASEPGASLADAAVGNLYVDDANGITVVSMANNSVKQTLALPAGNLTDSPNGYLLADSYGNTVYIINATLNLLVGEINVAGGAGSTVICSSGLTMYTSGNVISEIDLTSDSVVRTFPTNGWGLQLTPDCSTLYEVYGTDVDAVNTSTGAVSTVYDDGEKDPTAFTLAEVPVTYIIRPTPWPILFS